MNCSFELSFKSFFSVWELVFLGGRSGISEGVVAYSIKSIAFPKRYPIPLTSSICSVARAFVFFSFGFIGIGTGTGGSGLKNISELGRMVFESRVFHELCADLAKLSDKKESSVKLSVKGIVGDLL